MVFLFRITARCRKVLANFNMSCDDVSIFVYLPLHLFFKSILIIILRVEVVRFNKSDHISAHVDNGHKFKNYIYLFIHSLIHLIIFYYILFIYLLGVIMRYESSYAGWPPKNTKAEICNFVFYWVETSFPSKK